MCRSCLTPHQRIALIVVMQERLLEPVGDVRVAGVVLEVTLAEPVEGKLATDVIKVVVLLFFYGRGRGY